VLFPRAAVAEHQHAADGGVGRRDQQGLLHLVLADDGGERKGFAHQRPASEEVRTAGRQQVRPGAPSARSPSRGPPPASSPLRDIGNLARDAAWTPCQDNQRRCAVEHDLSLPVILSFVTLLIVVGMAVFQPMRVRRSQAERNGHPGGIAGPE